MEKHGDKIALKGFFGKYVSIQGDGSVEINRDVADDWELFTVYPRRCLA